MKKIFLLFLFLSIFGVIYVIAQGTVTHRLNYTTSGQSMWSSSVPINFDVTHELFNIQAEELNIEEYWFANIDGSMWDIVNNIDLSLFLNSEFSLNGFKNGTVSVNYPVDININFPARQAFSRGQTFMIQTTYQPQNGAAISTRFPTAGVAELTLGYGFSLDYVLGFTDNDTIDSSVQILPNFNIPPNPASMTPIPHDVLSIFNLDSEYDSYSFPCVDGTPQICGSSANLPSVLPPGLNIGISGEIDVFGVNPVSRVDFASKCLFATGTNEWFSLDIDLVDFLSFMSSYIASPNGPALNAIADTLEGGDDIPVELVENVELLLDYSFLNANLRVSGEITQELSFCPTISATMELPVALPYRVHDPSNGNIMVSQGTSDVIPFQVGHNIFLTYPCTGWDSIKVERINYHMQNSFHNSTYGKLMHTILVDAISFRLETQETNPDVICYPSNCGPLVSRAVRDQTLNFSWYDETWELGGFRTDTTCQGTWMVPLPGLELQLESTPVICHGESTGVISATAVNGTGTTAMSYTYLYAGETVAYPGPNTHNRNVPGGYYSILVTNLETSCTASASITVQDPNPPLALNLNVSDVLCHRGNTGSIYAEVTGGVQPYRYFWDGATDPGNSYLLNLTQGPHSLRVLDTLDCFIDGNATVDQPDEALHMISAERGMIACHGGNEGYVVIEVGGGTLPYRFNWSNGTQTQNLTNVPAGHYSVTVTDSKGCEISYTYVIAEPPQLEVVEYTTNIPCFGMNTGVIDITIEGGTPPYTYSWSNGASSQDLINISAGNYGLTITDVYGCKYENMYVITQPQFPLTTSVEVTNVRCFAEGNGSADLSVSGGTPPYTYQWSNGEGTEDIDNLVPNYYSVTITDHNGCTSTNNIQIVQPEYPMSGTIRGTHITCNGGNNGNVYITVEGGRSPYHFEWSNGSWQQDLVNVGAGTYTVTVKDINNCPYEMSFTVEEPSPYLIIPNYAPTICYGMTAEIGIGVITGNTPPYTVFWEHSDDNGMITTVNPTETTTYWAYVVDSLNCRSDQVEITVNVHEPLEMIVRARNPHVCPNTEVFFDVLIDGGGISPDHVYVNGTLMDIPVSVFITNDTLLNFVVYDACNFDSVRVSQRITTYPLPLVNITASQTSGCSPLLVNFQELSPDEGQTYIWNFDEGDFENLSFDKNPTHVFYNSRIHNVKLQVTSADGCKNEGTIQINVFPVPKADFQADRVLVELMDPFVNFHNYSKDGYWYYWDFGDGGASTVFNPSHTYSAEGKFRVKLNVLSLYGCRDSASLDITVLNGLTFYAPTAFTPNLDGVNDVFNLFITGFDQFTFRLDIFDSWGVKIFTTNEVTEGWNGKIKTKLCPQGVYTWQVHFKDVYGNEYEKTGYVTLLR